MLPLQMPFLNYNQESIFFLLFHYLQKMKHRATRFDPWCFRVKLREALIRPGARICICSLHLEVHVQNVSTIVPEFRCGRLCLARGNILAEVEFR